jgi:integrase
MAQHYSKHGKILEPLTFQEFEAALDKLQPRYQAFLVLLYYTGIRVTEGLRLVKESFRLAESTLYIEIGIREKTQRKNKATGKLSKGKQTDPLPLDVTLPHIDSLLHQVKYTRKAQRVFTFTRATAWNQMNKTGVGYNHRLRLTAITEFLAAGHSLAEVVNWTGMRVETINSYMGRVQMQEMGKMRR